MGPLMRLPIFLALTSIASAVSLSQFPPVLSSLPIPCQIVYRQDIFGCSATDFGSDGCSEGCVRALQAYTTLVDTACGNRNINGQNIIVAFLAGAGPQSICPNANEVLGLISPSSSSTAKPTTTRSPSSTSGTTQSTDTSSGLQISTSSSSTSSVFVTPTVISSSSSSAASVDSASTTSSTASSTASHSISKSGPNDNSGGGSPFDTEGNVRSVASALTCSILMSFLAASTSLLAGLR